MEAGHNKQMNEKRHEKWRQLATLIFRALSATGLQKTFKKGQSMRASDNHQDVTPSRFLKKQFPVAEKNA